MKFEDLIKSQPYVQHLGLQMVSNDSSGLMFRLEPEDRFIGNPMLRAFHGGILCSALECAMSLTVMLANNLETPPQLINQTTSFLGSASADKSVIVQAEITKQGKRILAAHARAYQDDADVLVAKGSVLFRASAVDA
ncbi:MAG: acyl-CoA thioesterase [Limisphaerales bacterium]|jgi:acyl-CoA thioesterase